MADNRSAADRYAWMDDTGCRKATERLEDGAFGELYQQNAYQRKYCKTCPVAYTCLRYAFHGGIWHGVFGGMTVAERSVFQIKFKRASAAAERAHEDHIAALR